MVVIPKADVVDTGAPEAISSAELQRHFARELHDQVAQPLVGVVLGVRELRDRQAAGDDIAGELAELEESVRLVLRETREILIDLRDQSARTLDFVEALVGSVAAPRDCETTIGASVRWPGQINGWAAFNLIRIVQHAIANAWLHGRAKTVDVFLDASDDEAVVAVLDDGAGIEQAEAGFGLIGMQERAIILGGSLDVQRRETRGTKVEIRVPLHRLAPTPHGSPSV